MKGMHTARQRTPSTCTHTQAVLRCLLCLQQFTLSIKVLDCNLSPRPWTVNTRPTQLEYTQTLGHLTFLSLSFLTCK